MSFKSCNYSFFAIISVLLFDLDNGVEPAASAGSDVYVFTLADLVDFIVDGGFFWHAHKELVLVFAC